jgi:hypothetical protein
MFTILITVAATSLFWSGWDAIHWIGVGKERLWLMSAVKAPGRMALDEIQDDLSSGRCESAKLKVEALKRQWAVFESEVGFKGQAIGNIMEIFSQLDRTNTTVISHPN